MGHTKFPEVSVGGPSLSSSSLLMMMKNHMEASTTYMTHTDNTIIVCLAFFVLYFARVVKK